MCQAAVDGPGRAACGAGEVELDQYVSRLSFELAAQGDDLAESRRDAIGDRDDQRSHDALALGLVGLAVSSDHLGVGVP